MGSEHPGVVHHGIDLLMAGDAVGIRVTEHGIGRKVMSKLRRPEVGIDQGRIWLVEVHLAEIPMTRAAGDVL
jgi:hypothetical protein